MDLGTGAVTGRVDLGVPQKGDVSMCVGVVDGGPEVLHWTVGGTELAVANRQGAAAHVVTRLPGTVIVTGAGVIS